MARVLLRSSLALSSPLPSTSRAFHRSNVPPPVNEPILGYRAGSPERAEIQRRVKEMREQVVDIPLIIDGKEVRTGKTYQVRIPHEHRTVLANVHMAGEKEVAAAVKSSLAAREEWANMAIFLKMADLLAGPHRQILNGSTVLGQSKNWFQAEIDAACEFIDFLRFNVKYVQDIISQQPVSSPGVWNRVEHRPLEGFVLAATPFNFTSIAGNLVTAPLMMGNVAIFKPSDKASLSNYYLMKLFADAGVPKGVVNFLPGQPGPIVTQLMNDENFAGLHFTGSTAVFKQLWQNAGTNLSKYKAYPRIVGETGGKDFVFAHASSNVPALATALIRGAFEFAGQKCSAASRAYVPKSIWPALKKELQSQMAEVKMGNPEDPSVLVNAVIDEGASDRVARYLQQAKASGECEILFGGKVDKSVGWFVEPTLVVTSNPLNKIMLEEIFAPVLALYVYDDAKLDETLQVVDTSSPYALTGSVFAQDRYALDYMEKKLQHAAGNFYINDKPTGAVVGQQPFGGGRGSGTNDKAGSYINLLRWTSVRAVKETFNPPTSVPYPYMKDKQ